MQQSGRLTLGENDPDHEESDRRITRSKSRAKNSHTPIQDGSAESTRPGASFSNSEQVGKSEDLAADEVDRHNLRSHHNQSKTRNTNRTTGKTKAKSKSTKQRGRKGMPRRSSRVSQIDDEAWEPGSSTSEPSSEDEIVKEEFTASKQSHRRSTRNNKTKSKADNDKKLYVRSKVKRRDKITVKSEIEDASTSNSNSNK
jgi:hypothetical protein